MNLSIETQGPQALSPIPDFITVIMGTTGNDFLVGTTGNDFIYANSGDDVVVTGTGNDTVWGGLGDDVLLGGAGNDSLFGDQGADILFGEDGNDVLGFGAGDVIFGGTGADRFEIDSEMGTGTVLFGDFNRFDGDVISFRNSVSADQLSLANGNLVIKHDGGTLIIQGTQFTSIAEAIASGTLLNVLPSVGKSSGSPEVCYFGAGADAIDDGLVSFAQDHILIGDSAMPVMHTDWLI